MINETDCLVEHKGMKFMASGARLDDLGGVVYVVPDDSGKLKATTWSGDFIAWVTRGKDWSQYSLHLGQYNMRSINFIYNDVTYFGRYNYDWQQSCKVKARK